MIFSTGEVENHAIERLSVITKSLRGICYSSCMKWPRLLQILAVSSSGWLHEMISRYNTYLSVFLSLTGKPKFS